MYKSYGNTAKHALTPNGVVYIFAIKQNNTIIQNTNVEWMKDFNYTLFSIKTTYFCIHNYYTIMAPKNTIIAIWFTIFFSIWTFKILQSNFYFYAFNSKSVNNITNSLKSCLCFCLPSLHSNVTRYSCCLANF